MHVLSVNVGMPREVEWHGATVVTGIFKEPVTGNIEMRTLNLDGDAQADLSVHGGPDKAVYAYPFEHYHDWETSLGRPLLPGAFGENLTTEGLLEDQVHIGDEFRIGTAKVVVTQPRMPCYKLGIRFGDPQMVKSFLKARRPGIYFAVMEEGLIGPGDPIELVGVTSVASLFATCLNSCFPKSRPTKICRRIIEIPGLAAVWREEFQARLENLV